MTPAANAKRFARRCPECGGVCTCGEPTWDTTCPHCLAYPAHIDAFPPPAPSASGWQVAEGNSPPCVGDSRKLVVLVDRDNMAWIGIRAYRHDLHYWTVNGDREESANVTHWQDLPAMPALWTGAEATLSPRRV